MIKGITFFRRWGFSINEGGIPNLSVFWGGPAGDRFFVYVCWGRRWKWSWASKPDLRKLDTSP